MFFKKRLLDSNLTLPWLLKSTAVCGVLGYTASVTILSDENLLAFSRKLEKLGIFPKALAFSTLENGLHPPHLHWDHKGFFKTYDHASGYQVYREVCSACHSLKRIYWRNLIGVSHTENEVKGMAAEFEYEDGPDETGQMFKRPGKPSDPMPSPYPNEEAARAANGGAYPPDLSCIVRARHGEEDYIFALLLGYSEPPAGVTIREGLHFNRYFPGGAISMAQSLYDEVVEYEDGTENSASQLSKDVTTFLTWASYPEFDERKKMGMKAIGISVVMLALSVYWKKFKWASLKSRKIVFKPSVSHKI